MKHPKLAAHDVESKLAELNAKSPFEWTFADDGISMKAKFADFVAAFAFMSMIAVVAEDMDHHPEWFNVYNKLDVRLSTHSAGGVTELDFELAHKMAEFF